MNTKYIKNIDLSTEIGGSGVISIYELTDQELSELNFLTPSGWPSGVFSQVISDLDRISPTTFEFDAKFFDPITDGYHLYNKFLEEGNNEDGY